MDKFCAMPVFTSFLEKKIYRENCRVYISYFINFIVELHYTCTLVWILVELRLTAVYCVMSRFFIEPSPEMAESFIYPCGACSKRVSAHMRAIQCDLCNYWNHIKCDRIEPSHYEKLKKSDVAQQHFCRLCKEELFPFQSLDNDQYISSVLCNVNVNDNLNLQINPPPRLKTLFSDLNDRNNEESLINCEYYDYSKSIPHTKDKNKSIFHMNAASLNKHKDELETALSLISNSM